LAQHIRQSVNEITDAAQSIGFATVLAFQVAIGWRGRIVIGVTNKPVWNRFRPTV